MSTAPIGETGIRPFVALEGVFDNALTAVNVDENGRLPSSTGVGMQAELGLYGHHSWKRSLLNLDYRGTYRHYTQRTFYDGSDQVLTFGFTHAFTKRLQLTLREAGGTYSRGYLLNTAGYYIPDLQGIPTNELFDNRVVYANTALGLTYQKSARLSFNFEGEGFLMRRRSSALYGVTGAEARGDFAYRLSRYTTVGADYEYNHFDFTKAVGGSEVHTAGLTFASRISRYWELGLYGGASRVESLFLTRVAIDPAIAAIIGQSFGIEVGYRVHYTPTVRARLSRRFRAGLFSLMYKREVSAGNGVYLTAAGDMGSATYTYTGVRYWNFSLGMGYTRLGPLIQEIQPYRSFTFGGGVSRELGRNLHMIARLDVRRYDSGVVLFERIPVRATFGFAWSPGERPLAIW